MFVFKELLINILMTPLIMQLMSNVETVLGQALLQNGSSER